MADGDVTTTEPARGYRDTIVAAACLGLVWPGDALIYVVLPLYPSVFGVEIATIAILLSVNRVIRMRPPSACWRRSAARAVPPSRSRQCG